MKIVKISEALSIDADSIESVLYPTLNVRKSRSSHAYETMKKRVEYARRYNKLYDITNSRDQIKSMLIMKSGTVYITSLTCQKIEDAISNKRKQNARTMK